MFVCGIKRELAVIKFFKDKAVFNPNGNRWNGTKMQSNIASDGLNANINSNANGWESISAEKAFIISVEFPRTILYYFEVTKMSAFNRRVHLFNRVYCEGEYYTWNLEK